MSFISPLGLIGLIGIPIIIIIYIIKSKYKEYTIASTYIWELSEKYLTKKSKISRISGLLSLILQILTVLVLSLALAHPIINIPDSAKKYVFVVDQSASMNINNRFQLAREQMLQIIDGAKNDSEFTVILAGDEPISICTSLTQKDKVKQLVSNMECSTLPNLITDGMSIAQNMFDEDPTLNVYLFSDVRYANSSNVEVINLEDKEVNVAIHSLYATDNDTTMHFMGEVVEYEYVEYGDEIDTSRGIELVLLLDDVRVATTNVELEINEPAIFDFEIQSQEFSEARVVFEGYDQLFLDNEYKMYYNSSITKFNVLLVSEKPFYIKSVLSILGDATLKTVSPSQYANNNDFAYDLYVFDGYAPKTLPTNGAIWLFNVKDNISNSGFVCQETVTLDTAAILSYGATRNDVFYSLTSNLTRSQISVKTYQKYNLVSSFTPIMTHNGNPIIFAGVNQSNNREIVFAFDLHDSNFPLLLDYVIFFNNMVKYTIPSICDQSEFTCGEDLVINVLPNCESIRVNTPDGYSTYLSTEEATASYHLSKLGTYEIEAVINGTTRNYQVYVSFPHSEEFPVVEAESIEILGEKLNKSFDSTYDIQWLLFIILLVLCILEWEVYLYEQRRIK